MIIKSLINFLKTISSFLISIALFFSTQKSDIYQFFKRMEEPHSRIRSKKQIAPKITHTKITISKSTPFLISKHHLDDTEMRNALHYDDRTVKNNHQRTYSYKGEVISCVNSKIKQRFDTFQSPSSPIPTPQEKTRREEYYPELQNKGIQVQQRTYKSRVQSNQGQPVKSNTKRHKEGQISKNKHKMTSEMNDYCMQERQLLEERKNLQRQTERLRKIYKKNVEKDLKITANKKITDLQDQIKQLKIKNLELQKQTLLMDCQKTKQIIDYQRLDKINLIQYNQRAQSKKLFSILNKPKFRIKHEQNEDTDSSFSSFELE